MTDNLKINCGYCQGHGLGAIGYCTSCVGRGFFNVDPTDPEWLENCEEQGLDPETGEELEVE